MAEGRAERSQIWAGVGGREKVKGALKIFDRSS
jgi:hypothetical protein